MPPCQESGVNRHLVENSAVQIITVVSHLPQFLQARWLTSLLGYIRCMSDTYEGESTGKLVVCAFLTLDGVMQAPGGPDEDRHDGFEHGGWLVDYYDEKMGEFIDAQFADANALLLGRKTYEIFAGYWPHYEPADDPVATKLNSIRKYVASRTLDAVDWRNSTLLSGDVAAAVEELKNERDDVIMTQGSADLIQTLLSYDLVDEFVLWVFPLVLGEGKRLFGDGTIPTALELTNVETSSTGVQILRYKRAGEIEYGRVDDVVE